MSKKSFTLRYFNLRGRGEISRLIFAAAGAEADYKDERIELPQWPELKPKTPLGSLPLLEFDGMVVCQSVTIARFLARHYGIAGKNPLEEMRADQIVDTLTDISTPLGPLFFEKDEAKKAELLKELNVKTASLLASVEKMLVDNRGGNGYFVGGELTWADLHFFALTSMLDNPAIGLTVDWNMYPKLVALKNRVGQLPRIASWVQRRPQTPF